MKKSQVAIFFVLAILILILVMFLFIRNPIAAEERKEITSFEQTKEVFESYINQCLVDTTDRAVKRYGLEYINEQLEEYTKNHLLECMNNFEDFKKMGYDVVFLNPKINITINEKKVDSILNVTAELSSETDRARFNLFQANIEYPEELDYPKEGFEWKFRGILYKYVKSNNPRPNDIFIAKIDLEDPTVKYYVTQKIEPNLVTTSSFLMQNGLQLAINGGPHNETYPHNVMGFYASGGTIFSSPEETADFALVVSKNNEVSIGKDFPKDIEYAIGYMSILVIDGATRGGIFPDNPGHKPQYDNLEPRTSAGVDEKENWLILIIVDGRNLGVSEGVNYLELAQLFLDNNAYNAINLDGGGSSTLVMQEGSGFKVYNNPSDGAERPVADHFGVYAEEMPIIQTALTDNTDTRGTPTPSQGGNDGNSISKYRTVSPGIGAGGQPSEEGYKWLASQGYKTIIDVQGIDNSAAVNAAGMNYIYLPYNGNPPSTSWVNNVVSAMRNPANQPVYVHCQYGEHRTGVAIAIYREQVEGVCYQQAYNELMTWADNYFPGTEQEKTAVFNMIWSYSSC